MPVRADILVAQTTGLVQFNGAGTQSLVQTPTGVLYCVYINSASDVAFKKSTTGGLTWSNPTVVFAGTVTALSIWYDRWSGIAAGLIHCAYQESATDDTLYRTINTESSDALSTQTVIFAGASTAAGGMLTICRAVGGNVYCKTTIDAGAEGGFYRLPTANVPNGAWDAARTNNEALATQDMGILVPNLNNADTQDMLLIFWDVSANQISRYNYDDSANTWAETIFTGTFTEQVATTSFPHFGVDVDLANSQILVVAWNAIDTLNADLTCWTVTESAITAKTDVVTNSTDDQALCGICLDTINNIWWVYYAGATGGGETWLTSVNLYCKGSTDGGATWGPETLLTTASRNITWIGVLTRMIFPLPVPPPVLFHNDLPLDEINLNVALPQRRVSTKVGI